MGGWRVHLPNHKLWKKTTQDEGQTLRNDVQANDDFIARRSYYWMPYCIYIHKGFKKEGMKESTFGPLLLRPFVLVINVFLTYDNFQHQMDLKPKEHPLGEDLKYVKLPHEEEQGIIHVSYLVKLDDKSKPSQHITYWLWSI